MAFRATRGSCSWRDSSRVDEPPHETGGVLARRSVSAGSDGWRTLARGVTESHPIAICWLPAEDADQSVARLKPDQTIIGGLRASSVPIEQEGKHGERSKKRRRGFAVVAATVSLAASASATTYGPWAAAVNVQSIRERIRASTPTNSTAARSSRGTGRRSSWPRPARGARRNRHLGREPSPRRRPWGAPVNVGAPVNSSANDFCPIARSDGQKFLFVSNRVIAGACGGADIYTTRLRRDGTFKDSKPRLRGQQRSRRGESLPHRRRPLLLERSSWRLFAGGTRGDRRRQRPLRERVARRRVRRTRARTGCEHHFEDGQPNVRRDGRELFFYSNRPGTLGGNERLLGDAALERALVDAGQSWAEREQRRERDKTGCLSGTVRRCTSARRGPVEKA